MKKKIKRNRIFNFFSILQNNFRAENISLQKIFFPSKFPTWSLVFCQSLALICFLIYFIFAWLCIPHAQGDFTKSSVWFDAHCLHCTQIEGTIDFTLGVRKVGDIGGDVERVSVVRVSWRSGPLTHLR